MSEIFSLSEIANVIDCEHKTAPTVDSSEYYSIRTTDISNGRLAFEQANRVSQETFIEWTRRAIPQPSDLILAREAPVGEVGYIPNGYAVCLGQRTVLIQVTNEAVDRKYLLYYLTNPATKHDLRVRSTGSVVAHLNMKDIRSFEISIPPLTEQRAIASVLSALDDKIDLLHRQNRTLESLAQALFRHWFSDGAGEDWEEGVIPDEFDFTMGLSPAGSSYNEDAIGTPMFQGNADFGFRFPENRVYTTDPKRFAERFDTLVSVRAPVGAQNMAYERCCIGRGVAAFRHKGNPEYYTYTYFKFHSLMDEIKQFNDEGTVFGSIGKRDFMEFKIVIPPKDKIRQFQEIVKPIDDKVIANCNAIRTLAALRDSLLPKLMSGEVRVRG